MTRKEAREQAFVFLFEKLFNPELSYDELNALAAQCRFCEPDDYMKEVFVKTDENTERRMSLSTACQRAGKQHASPR